MTQPADELKQLMIRFGRLASLRDPFAPIWDREGVRLTPTELHIVMWLGVDGTLPMSELAARVKTTSPNCTRAVDKLVNAGFALRRRNPNDRRSVLARLSARGKRLCERIDAVTARQLESFLEILDPPDRSTLLEILARAAQRLEVREQTTNAKETAHVR